MTISSGKGGVRPQSVLYPPWDAGSVEPADMERLHLQIFVDAKLGTFASEA